WDYDAEQYPWIPVGSPLEQSYGLDDLAQHSGDCDVQATVAVQARQTLKETDWLLGLAKESDLCKAVVGWVPLQDDNIVEVLDRYKDEPMLKGVRHVIQDEEDPAFMLRPAFLRGLETLSQTDLRYDILIFGHQLPNTIKMVDALPGDMPLVLDHIAKPVIAPGKFDEQWAHDFAELAKRPNVLCKLSGMATEVRGGTWDSDVLEPYLGLAFEAFGPSRLMFGSDWPVALLKTDYPRWVATVAGAIGSFSPDDQDRIMYRNAAAFYGIQ
ncbi:MAG: amidohydrolase family protein, partial [Phycisphaeraceae bacterium]|nr:amidohydrolase family protein [Phycisphaeraceae bacterium]